MKSKDFLPIAMEAAKKAGGIIRREFYKPKIFSTKSSTIDPVTATDKECEELIVKEIRSAYPEHNIIAEEGSGNKIQTDGVPTWYVDPIDGTNNFIHSLPHVCVSIGVMVNSNVVLGVVHNPILDETYHAIKGGGAFLNGKSLSVSKVQQLEKAAISTDFGYDRSNEGIARMLDVIKRVLLSRAQTIRMFGSCALEMCYVASGKLDAYYEGKNEKIGPKSWDVCAGSLIVEEAGGVCFDPANGKVLKIGNGRVLVSGTHELAQQILGATCQTEKTSLKRKENDTERKDPRAKKKVCESQSKKLKSISLSGSAYLMPSIAFGTGGTWYKATKEKAKLLENMVKKSLEIGYIHIDCAEMYQNEKYVGKALNEFLSQSKLNRKDLFITSKVSNSSREPKALRAACEASLKNLGLTYLDLYLIHSPFDANDLSWTNTWCAMEALVEEGMVKKIGVSNFRICDLQEILKIAKIKPVVNQIECNPCLLQPKLRQFCIDKDIQIVCYASVTPLVRKTTESEPFLSALSKLSNKYGKSKGQILIRWSLQHGNAVVATSTKLDRNQSNLDVFDFELQPEELELIDELGQQAPSRTYWIKQYAGALDG